MTKYKQYVKTILINDRYLIYPDGAIYDTKKAKDIPEYIFQIRDKLNLKFVSNEEIKEMIESTEG